MSAKTADPEASPPASAPTTEAPPPGPGPLDGAARGPWPCVLLTLLCLILFAPGLSTIPALDRDEARFVQATAQMLETGDYVDIRFQEKPRHKKPAGIHWLQAGSVKTLTHLGLTTEAAREIWTYRLPSALAAWLAVLLTFAIGRTLFDRTTGLVAGVFMASSVLLILEAHQAKADAALLAATLLGVWGLAQFHMAKARDAAKHERPGILAAGAVWVSLGLGIMIKGPVTPLVLGLLVLTLMITGRSVSWLRGLRPVTGLALTLVIAAPWYVAIHQATGGAFAETAVTKDLLPKLLRGVESHGAPPGYHLGLVLVFFWPGVLLLLPAFARAWGARKTHPGIPFCFAWLIPAWILFEAVPTKLPHYVLPLYPALALITAWAVLKIARGEAKPVSKALSLPLGVLWTAVGVVFMLAAVFVPTGLGHGFSPDLLAALAIGMLAATLVLGDLLDGSGARAAITGAALGGLVVASVIGTALPKINAMWLSRDAAGLLAASTGSDTPPVAASGYHEPSLVFHLGTKTLLTGPQGAAAALKAGAVRGAVIEANGLAAFEAALGSALATVEKRGVLNGINYSKGDTVVLHVFARRPASPSAAP